MARCGAAFTVSAPEPRCVGARFAGSAWLLALLPFFLLPSCSSPFGAGDVPERTDRIAGAVHLSDFADPADIFVWLEGFNLSVRADSQGRFALVLPEKALQTSTPSGVAGLFRLYFFSANYYLKTADVLIRNGEFLYGKGDVLQDGTLVQEATLTKFLDIRTELSREEIPSRFDSTLVVTTTMAPLAVDDSIGVILPAATSGRIDARVYLIGLDADRTYSLPAESYSLFKQGEPPQADEQFRSVHIVTKKPLILTAEIRWHSNSVAAGRYQIRPFLWLNEQEIPPGLLATLEFNPDTPTVNYLNIPYGIQAAILNVSPSE